MGVHVLDLDLSSVFADSAHRGAISTIDVLVVCTGNICRSPLAAQVLRTRLADLDVHIGSAGTYGQVGEKMDRNAAKLAVSLGVPKTVTREHRGRWLSDFHLRGTDLVLTMTSAQLSRVTAIAPAHHETAFSVREFERLAQRVDDDAIRDAAASAGPENHHRVHAALRLVAAQRENVRARLDDIVDPHRQPWSVFQEAAQQMLPGLDQVARVLRLSLP
jgi:protein-tyrosine phosphatase